MNDGLLTSQLREICQTELEMILLNPSNPILVELLNTSLLLRCKPYLGPLQLQPHIFSHSLRFLLDCNTTDSEPVSRSDNPFHTCASCSSPFDSQVPRRTASSMAHLDGYPTSRPALSFLDLIVSIVRLLYPSAYMGTDA